MEGQGVLTYYHKKLFRTSNKRPIFNYGHEHVCNLLYKGQLKNKQLQKRDEVMSFFFLNHKGIDRQKLNTVEENNNEYAT